MRTHTQIAFGRRLMEERIVAGLTQAKLAAALRVTSDTLQEYELDERRIPVAVAAQACRALGLRTSNLMCESPRVEQRRRGVGKPLRWVGVPRPTTALSQRTFSGLGPLLKEWRAARGELTGQVRSILVATGLLPRTYILHLRQRSLNLVIESHAYGVAHVLPCESLTLIGREFPDMYDSEYGAWIAEPYAEASWTEQIGIELVRALIRTAAGPTLLTRYDRVVIPWRRGGDAVLMGVSLKREEPRPVCQDAL